MSAFPATRLRRLRRTEPLRDLADWVAQYKRHWEESFVGMEIEDLDNPVELFHLVRSHDACLVCTVHMATARRFRL